MQKKWMILSISAVLIFIGGIVWFQKSRKPIEWISLKRGPIIEAIYGLGTVTSHRVFRVKAGVPTTIQKILVKEGDSVKAGDALITLADQPTIVAPFHGTVTSIPFEPGENVFPQFDILTIVDTQNLYLSMSLEQSAALLVRRGQKASLMFESQRNLRFDGVVKAIVPKDGQFVIHLDVDQWPEGILPGMTADTSITVGKVESAVLIPLRAIQGFRVQIRKDQGKVDKCEVKLGVVSGDWAELIDPKLDDPEKYEVAIQP